jgi:hypothetical protein
VVGFAQEAAAAGRPSAAAFAWLERRVAAAADCEAHVADLHSALAGSAADAAAPEGSAARLELLLQRRRHEAELAARDAELLGLKGRLEGLLAAARLAQAQPAAA